MSAQAVYEHPVHPIRDECCDHSIEPCEYHAGWLDGYEEGERAANVPA